MKIYIIIIPLLAASLASSQNSQIISLEQAVNLAKTNNTTLKIADKEIEKQIVLKKTAFELDPLQLQYQGGQFNDANYDNNITAQQYFPLGKITKANRQLQGELIKLAEKRKALSEYEIEKAVTLAYYQYLYGVSIQNLNNELKVIYSDFFKNAETRLKVGETGELDVISAKAKAREMESIQAQLQYDLVIYQKQLQYFVQTEENIVPDSATSLQYVNIDNSNKGKLDGLLTDFYLQQISVYQQEAQIYKAQSFPKLGIGYFGQTNRSVGPSFYQGFTIGLQIPLFNNANKARAAATMISQEQSKLEMDRSKSLLNLQTEQLQNEFEKQKIGLEYYQKEGLEYARQIINVAQKSYDSGEMDYDAYIGYLNQAIDIKKQYIEALNLYNQSAIQLQFPSAVGQ